MDPINLLTGIVLFLSLSANFSGARKAFKKNISGVAERPKTFLQKTPLNISALLLLLILLGVFNVGTISSSFAEEYGVIRIIGLIMFGFFGWLQVLSYKSFGDSYSQEIVILKKHTLVTEGLYKIVRHPQYLCQVLSDIGAGLALMSYLVLPVALFIELPLFIMRALFEEKLLVKHFGEKFEQYKKSSGFFIPFIG